MESNVIAQWGNRQYPAVLNSYGVATIPSYATAISSAETDHELHAWADDGGATIPA